MQAYALSALFNAVSSIVLGALVYSRGNDKKLNRDFFMYSASVTSWSIPYFFWLQSTNSITALLWLKLLTLGSITIPIFYSNFVHRLTGIPKNKYATLALYVSAATLSVFDFSSYLVQGIYPFAGFEYWPVSGQLYSLFVLYYLVVVLYGTYMLYAGSKKYEGDRGRQLQLIFIGSVIGYGGGATNFPLWFGIHLPPVGNIGVTIYSLFVTYAILTQHLFDLKIFFRRTIIYSALLAILFSGFSVIVLLAPTVIPFQTQQQQFFIQFLASLIVGFSFDPLKRWLQDRTDKFLYKKEYAQQNVLQDLSKQLNNVIGLDEALEIVMQTILKTFRVNRAVTYIFQPSEHGTFAVKRIKQIGFTKDTSLMLSERDFVIEYFCASAQIVTLDQMRSQYAQQNVQNEHSRSSRRKPVAAVDTSLKVRTNARLDVVIKKLASLKAEVMVPLHLGDQFIGLLILSNKLSDDRFTANDIQLLGLAGQAAISSIQKARLYEGDQMKSEFVSIASHELLTPISAIEGYLSMILDENIGTIDDQARNYLTKVYTSSKRLSQLVKDLLSVSRIESGRMSMLPQAVDVDKLIKETLEQLHFLAKNKGLELNYAASAKPLPMAKADPDRVTQVLTNLVSNAIKYTPAGSVTIKAAATKSGELRISVSDTGLGMTRQARSHLFEKFYRIASDETIGIIGTGLGLYITRSILEKMGGTITVESVPKRGSTFTVTLPCFEAEDVVRYS